MSIGKWNYRASCSPNQTPTPARASGCPLLRALPSVYIFRSALFLDCFQSAAWATSSDADLRVRSPMAMCRFLVAGAPSCWLLAELKMGGLDVRIARSSSSSGGGLGGDGAGAGCARGWASNGLATVAPELTNASASSFVAKTLLAHQPSRSSKDRQIRKTPTCTSASTRP